MVSQFRTRPLLWFAAVVGLAAAAQLLGVPSTRAEQGQQPAAEMLQDGLDALSDRQADLAAQLFEQLILAYPGTVEADRAEQELAALGTAEPKEPNAPIQAMTGEEPLIATAGKEPTSALRMKFAVEAGDRVFFAEDSAVIGARARALLENQARWLKKLAQAKITIVGRADDGGSADDERALSAKRAEAVRDKLVAYGIPASKITIDARGKRDPIATCTTTLCQAQNRQAESVLSIVAGRPDTLGAVSGLPSAGDRARGAAVNGVGGVTVSR